MNRLPLLGKNGVVENGDAKIRSRVQGLYSRNMISRGERNIFALLLVYSSDDVSIRLTRFGVPVRATPLDHFRNERTAPGPARNRVTPRLMSLMSIILDHLHPSCGPVRVAGSAYLKSFQVLPARGSEYWSTRSLLGLPTVIKPFHRCILFLPLKS